MSTSKPNTKTTHLVRTSTRTVHMASTITTKPNASVSTSSGSSSGSSTMTTTPEHPSPELSVASTSYVVPPPSASPSPSRLSRHHPHFPNHDPQYYHTQTSIDSSPPPYTEATSTSRLRLAESQDGISIDSFKPQAENHQFPPSSHRYQQATLPLSRPQTSTSSRGDPYTNSYRPSYETNSTLAAGAVAKEKRLGHRRVNPEGEVTYKNIQSSQIMYSIQLGIGHSVGSLASKPERDVLYNDFNQVETVAFPKTGSQTTPAHHYSDFEFITYTPNAFRHFRDLFRIQPDDFMLSMTNGPLQELSNPGASGSVFYRTDDDQFVIKTVEKNESKFLLKLLPGYYMNLSQNPHTLLPKFFGLYTYECAGKNIRLIVMNNLLPSYIKLHEKYDLKGSTYKRKASDKERDKTSPTFKDLDFLEKYHLMSRFSESKASLAMKEDERVASNGSDGSIYEDTEYGGLQLESHIYDELINTLQRDVRVLESFEIMDYSLLVGVHNYDRFIKEGNVPTFDYDDDDDLPVGAIRAQNHKGERLLLFVGIIDILQSFRLFKRVEHAWKALLHDGDTISVHRPKFYARRFLSFMQKYVFGRLPPPPESSSKNDKFSHYYQVAEHQKKYGFNSLNRNFLGTRQFGTQFR